MCNVKAVARRLFRIGWPPMKASLFEHGEKWAEFTESAVLFLLTKRCEARRRRNVTWGGMEFD